MVVAANAASFTKYRGAFEIARYDAIRLAFEDQNLVEVLRGCCVVDYCRRTRSAFARRFLRRCKRVLP